MRASLESLGRLACLLLMGAVLACAVTLVGCEKKETLFDLDTPAGGVEVQKSNAGVEVEVESRDRCADEAEIEMETGGEAGEHP